MPDSAVSKGFFGLFCYFYFLKYTKKTVASIRNGYSY